jgi:hypothetical protein
MRLFPRRSLALLLPAICLLASCSDDFEIAAPYKPVTVVYGILNQDDTAQYIRIQKAFLDENKSALDMAKDADSNFFSSLEVHLREIGSGSIIHDELLRRVDLNKEGYPKVSGIFFDSVNYVYKATQRLNPDSRYRLVVINHASGQVDSAETDIISTRFTVEQFLVPAWTYKLNLGNPSSPYPFTLSVNNPANAASFDATIQFYYAEKNLGSGVETQMPPLSYQVPQVFGGSSGFRFQVLQKDLYALLKSAIPNAPSNVVRYLDSARVTVWAGSKDFETYRRINGASGGLTGDQVKPIYTNIKGEDVYGLFTSRARQFRIALLTDESADSLRYNPVTASLNFQAR